MTPQARTPSPARWIRTLPWMAGLLIGASAHIMWWTSPRPSSEPAQRVVTVPGPSVHVHFHARGKDPQAGDAKPRAARRAHERAKARMQPRAVGGARGALVCSASGCTIRRSFLAKLLDQPSLLGDGIGVRPVQDTGQDGLQLSGVSPGSVPDLLGLRSFDTIVAIGDRAMRRPSDLAEVARALDHAGGFTMSVHRNGLRLALHHTVVDG